MGKQDDKKHTENAIEESEDREEAVGEEIEEKKEKCCEGSEKHIEKLLQQVEELDHKWKRAVADYQNLEKWNKEQRGEWIKSSNKDLLLRILPILDTLIIAQQHSQDQNLKISADQFLAVLKSEGITKIDTIGKEFDPNIMEAISTESGEENKVINEVRSGYMLNDKVLRAAQVIVGQEE